MASEHGHSSGTSAHTTADGGKPPFPPFESHTFPSQLVWLVVSFVLLYVIVSRLALPRVGGILAARQKAISDDLAAAQKLRDESDNALKAYETELANARGKAQAIGAETRDKLNAQSEQERKTLEDRLAVKLAEAEKTIAGTRAAAMSNVREIASEAATTIVHQLTGAQPDAKAVESAVDASLRG
ncbi:MAG: F0F1 ATP synthase subunit B [Rhizobiales bacterium]|nr:F0F1 ATP synthase subunit B [Hyphomicrobiales bacterium]MBN9012279.1 F0F1 ATP synthase subunit B [Hyphomicrobiales bacterium]